MASPGATSGGSKAGRSEATNAAVIADGPDGVLKRVREQLALGASQIELHADGGVSSLYDPIDVAQYTEAEFLAAVEAAKNAGARTSRFMPTRPDPSRPRSGPASSASSSPAAVLAMATSTNAELLALSGPRNPHPEKLGVVEEGALADLLLVDGDPTENTQLIADPDENLLVIMKDGRLFKDRLR